MDNSKLNTAYLDLQFTNPITARRYSVTLNAPTTAVKSPGGQLTSHVDQDTVYHLSILDTAPIPDEVHQYHSVVRICLHDAPPETSSRPLSMPERSANTDICRIEYAPFPSKSGSSPQVLPVLHSALEKSFSVTWSSSTITGGSYCLIPIKFCDFSGPGNVALKLVVGTERIQMIDATLSRAEQYEESFACVQLFSGGDAHKTRAAEIADIEQQIIALQRSIEQARITPEKTTLAHTNKEDALPRKTRAETRTTNKRKAPTDSQPVPTCMTEHANLTSKLLTARKRLSDMRPVQVFRVVVSAQGERPQFHMPSQQTKCSNTATPINRKGKESKTTKIAHESIYKSPMKRQEQDSYNTTSASSKVPTTTAEISRRRRRLPVVCFYVRPEHLPNADYMAIYLSEQDFPKFLSAIACKLQIPMGTIGTIYYYDQHMTPVVVNEISIKSMSHEQDFIVRLPWAAKQFSELPGAAQHLVPFTADASSDHASIFEQYLTAPLEGSYATSIGSWSDFTDDASLSMSHMFAQSATMSPAGEVHYEGRHLHHSVSGEQGIDFASYTFDATLPTISLSSTSMQNMLQLATPRPDTQPTLPPQPEIVQLSAIEARCVAETAHLVKEEPAETRSLSIQSPPVSHMPAAERPSSLRTYRRPPSVESIHSDCKISKTNTMDRNVAYSLERNRLAAMKCRVTRKEKETGLQNLSKEKLKLNAELKDEIRRLEAEITEAKSLLKRHVTCVPELW